MKPTEQPIEYDPNICAVCSEPRRRRKFVSSRYGHKICKRCNDMLEWANYDAAFLMRASVVATNRHKFRVVS